MNTTEPLSCLRCLGGYHHEAWCPDTPANRGTVDTSAVEAFNARAAARQRESGLVADAEVYVRDGVLVIERRGVAVFTERLNGNAARGLTA